MDAFDHLIFAVESVGEDFNILQINFGRNGTKSSCKRCKSKKLAKLEEETYEKETLCC